MVDGNVERVLSRLRALALDPKRGAGRREVRKVAAELLDRTRPGDWNQALMELGATVCTPRSPGCSRCPLAPECQAVASGEPERFPFLERPSPSVHRALIAAVVEEDDQVLLFRRPGDEGLLAGTWEVPWVEASDQGAPVEDSFRRAYGGRWKLSPPLARVSHSITRYRLDVRIHRARVLATSEIAEGREAGWFTSSERKMLPHSSLLEKVLDCSEVRSEPRVARIATERQDGSKR